MSTRIEIDPNLRVRGGTYALFGDVDWTSGPGYLNVGDDVEVYEPDSGMTGPGRVTEIDLRKRLIYLSVAWAELRWPEDDSNAEPEAIPTTGHRRGRFAKIRASRTLQSNPTFLVFNNDAAFAAHGDLSATLESVERARTWAQMRALKPRLREAGAWSADSEQPELISG